MLVWGLYLVCKSPIHGMYEYWPRPRMMLKVSQVFFSSIKFLYGIDLDPPPPPLPLLQHAVGPVFHFNQYDVNEGGQVVLRLSTPILSRPQTSMLYNYAWEEYKNGWLSNPYLSAEVILCTA